MGLLMTTETPPSPSRRRTVVTAALVCLAVLAVLAGSVTTYLLNRHDASDDPAVFGDVTTPDRVDLTMWINSVDTRTQTATVVISDITPLGRLADDDGDFSEDLQILTDSIRNEAVQIKAGQWPPDIEQQFALYGIETDYPFDRYTADPQIQVVGPDGGLVPTSVSIYNTDSFVDVTATKSDDQTATTGVEVDLSLARSMPTLMFAIFIMVLMLGLALAAAIAAYYVIRWRRGLTFAPCSMMAALLFALVPLRNAVPGSPPIGSVIDFGSFFIAEIVISVSLILSVTLGYRIQMQKSRVYREGRYQLVN
jgi:hypothetical protein